MIDKIDYINSQIGNPDGDDIPNKKYYDPRVWLRKGEEAFKARLTKAFEDFKQHKYSIKYGLVLKEYKKV
jgi:fructose-bisphosphate aldolase class II